MKTIRRNKRYVSGSVAVWLAAIALFGFLDIATTVYGLHGYATEMNILYPYVLDQFAFVKSIGFGFAAQLLVALSAWKIVVLAVFYTGYRIVPYPFRLGIPFGLVLLGTMVVFWNLLVIVVA